MIDPNGNTTGYTFDEAGHRAMTVAPTVTTETGGGAPIATHPVTTVGYDTFGEQTETSDPNGNSSTSGYDAAGRPTSVTLPAYTPPGATTPVTAVSKRDYNNLGQLKTATDPVGNQTTYTYDQLGNIATVTAPNGGLTHNTYDTNGEQLSATDPTGGQTQATYDYLGRKATATQLVRQPAPAAYTTIFTYDGHPGQASRIR